MADSTSNLDLIQVSQSSKEVTANSFFTAASPVVLWGLRDSTSAGLVWGYNGGKLKVNGAIVSVAPGTITLGASLTTYIEGNPDTGAVTQNVLGWTPGRVPLYIVITGPTGPTSYTDSRPFISFGDGLASVTTSGDLTLPNAAAECAIIEVGGSPSASFTLIFPARAKEFTLNNTTAQSCVASVGTGGTVTIAAGKVAKFYTKSGGVVRTAADL